MRIECLICFEEFGGETNIEEKVISTKCGHLFHESCFNGWLQRAAIDATCAQCRAQVNRNELRRIFLSNEPSGDRNTTNILDSTIVKNFRDIQEDLLEIQSTNESEIQSLKRELKDLQEQCKHHLDHKDNQIDVLKLQVQTLRAEIENENEIQSIKKELKTLEEQLKNKDRQIDVLKNELVTLREKMENKNEIQSMKMELQVLEEKLKNKDDRIGILNDEVETLREQMANKTKEESVIMIDD